ncbi:DUF4418 family protein [Actinomyces sp. W5033]|uniref:DUF4418 family protein n=1 Tax=Actinomyces sp. W5033 TaxID=3446479 RepID=UPI003EDF4E04
MKIARTLPLAAAALAALLAVGVTTVFSACDPKPDGTWMHCHHCQNQVTAGGALLALVLGASAFVRNRALRAVLQALGVVGAVVVLLLPGIICPLCMMETMRCHTVFQPFTRIMSVLVAGTATASLATTLRGERRPAGTPAPVAA